ncbi:hypothetical protein NH288_05085 [Anaerococcus sp. NML200537]|uniref:hypothetical protein n=1 Tax=Anaerococcus sp. NML200537 TaxID=2954485 RepID=UPI00223831A2|nr:hypothetical protein [Anaerococcus sp. NML200537]MCW6701458.1 hypothetical protein [Anaerococcus sp. NML200537]
MKKSLILALALLTLVGCETKKDDTKEVKELKQEIKDLKANVKELEGSDNSTETDDSKDKEESKLLATLETNPNIDPQSIDASIIQEVLNNPVTIFEKFISETAKNSGADEMESARGAIGYALEVHNMQGIKLNSVPIYAALQEFVYSTIYGSNAPVMQKAIVDVGLENPDLPINNFNLFIDKEVASEFKNFKKAYDLEDLINLHEQYQYEQDDPIFNSIINFKGEFGYEQEEASFPGGIHITSSIGGQDSQHSAYFFYVSTEPANIQETQNANLWAVPIAYIDMPFGDLFDPNYDPDVIVDHLKLSCLVTGPGLKDF